MGTWTLQQPDPWSRWAIVDDRGTELADGPYEQKQAGVMMAAAPVLYAACEAALPFVADIDGDVGAERCANKLRAALAKARGE